MGGIGQKAMREGLFTAGGVVQGRGGSPQTAGTTLGGTE